MSEQFSKISQQITNLWNKYDKKQKIRMGSIAFAVIVSLVVLVLFLNRTNMVNLISNITPLQASNIKEALSENGITFEVSNDGTSVKVDEKQYSDAKMALAVANIPTAGFTYDDAFTNSLSTTDSERQLKFKLAKEQALARDLHRIDGIVDAVVTIVIPDDSKTVLKQDKEAKASAILTTTKELSSETVLSVVNYLVGSIDKLTEANVKLSDHKGRILYMSDEDSMGGTVSTNKQYEFQMTLINRIEKNLTAGLISTGLYDDAEVMTNLVLDFNTQATISEEYEFPEDGDRGIIRNIYTYTAEGNDVSASGIPGTDTNGVVTDYQFPDENTSNSSVEQEQIQYEINKIITETNKSVGGIQFDRSSIGIVLSKYKIFDQEKLEADNTLEAAGLTYDAFKQANMQSVEIPVDQSTIDLVIMATGIENIKVTAYEIPKFVDKIVVETNWTKYLPIIIVVIIFVFLAFVVYKGTRPVEVTEIDTGLSVEDLLASTREAQIPKEEIPVDDQNETRKMIEKFVDDKPEAAAQLLRNWLNEGWE